MKHLPLHHHHSANFLPGLGINMLQTNQVYYVGGFALAMTALLIIYARLQTKKDIKWDATNPGLYGITGRFGSGKSYFLTWCAYLALKANRIVFCTYELKGFKTFSQWEQDSTTRHANCKPTNCNHDDDDWVGPVLIEESNEKGDGKGWMQIIRVPNNSLVIIDEAQGWWPSDVRKVPLDVRMWVSTLRHRGITMYWGTQYVDAVAKWLIKLSFGIWEAEQSRGIHKYTLFDPRLINGKPGTRKIEARIRLKRLKYVQDMYDTHNSTTVARRRAPLSTDELATLGGLTITPTLEHDENDDDNEQPLLSEHDNQITEPDLQFSNHKITFPQYLDAISSEEL